MTGLSLKNKYFGWSTASLVVAALVALPMIYILASLFVPADASWTHLRNTILPSYISNTAMLMVLVAILSTSMGVITAWFVAATEFPGRKFFAWALVLPLAAPAYVIAYVYTDFLEFSGPVQSMIRNVTGFGYGDYWFPNIRSLPGAALMLSLVLYPYIYLLTRAAFANRSATLFEAARSLGKPPIIAFGRVAVPAARPAIAGGLALVLMETIADFGVVDYFAIPTFSTGIFRTWYGMGEKQAAVKLAAWMFILVAFLVTFERVTRRGTTTAGLSRDAGTIRLPLKFSHGIIAFIACFLPVFFGCLLPLGILLQLTLENGDKIHIGSFLSLIKNSFSVAIIAALITTILALLLAYTRRLAPTRLNRATIGLAILGYALPGTMLAVGLLAPLSTIDKSLTGFMVSSFGWTGGLVLTGTTFTLLYAYIIRFLTVAYNACASGLDAIHPNLDAAALSLGATPGIVTRRIHLPLTRNAILAAALLVFVDVMRELPATLLLRPFNFDTLATRVYRLAADERLAEAATPALTIVLVGLLPTLFLSILMRSNPSGQNS